MSGSKRARRSAGALALLLLGGCTVLGLDTVEPFRCERSSQCAPLNEALGVDLESCAERYVCAPDGLGCVLGGKDLDEDGFVDAACGGRDCDDRHAEAHPGAEEVCDGLDNDCDGRVDGRLATAGLAAPTVLRRLGPASAASAAGPWAHLAVVADGRTDPVVPFGLADRTSLFFPGQDEADATADPPNVGMLATAPGGISEATPVMGCPAAQDVPVPPPSSPPRNTTPETCQTHAECSDGNACNGWELCDPGRPGADARGCRPAEVSDPCAAMGAAECSEARQTCLLHQIAACRPGELVAAPAGEGRWFVLSVDELGCEAGVARVGYLTSAESAAADGSDPGRNVLQRGDARRSTVYGGIGGFTGQMDPCLGAYRGDGAVRGLALPRMASLPADPVAGRKRPQALVAWLAAPHCSPDERCMAADQPAEPAALEVLGLWLEEHQAGGVPVAWVNGTGDGVPQPLGSPGPVRPFALVALGGDAPGYLLVRPTADGLVLWRLEPLADPPGLAPVPPYATPIVPDAPPRSTERMPLPDAPWAALSSVEAREVAAAAAPGGSVGLAWADGEGVRWLLLQDVPEAAPASLGEPSRLGMAADAEDLVVSYVAEGLSGSTPDEPGAEGSTGGWVVAWRQRGTLFLVRVAGDGRLLDAPPLQWPVERGSLRPVGAVVAEDGRVRPIALRVGGEAGGLVGELLELPGVCGVGAP